MDDMSPEEAREFIRHNKFGVLGLADGGRAYALPLFYGYDGRDIYFQTHHGLKEDYVAATTEACFTIVRVMTLDKWASVQVFGKLEEVPVTEDAMHALMSVPLPPIAGKSELGEPARSDADLVVCRLKPARMSGRYSESAPESPEEREIALGGM